MFMLPAISVGALLLVFSTSGSSNKSNNRDPGLEREHKETLMFRTVRDSFLKFTPLFSSTSLGGEPEANHTTTPEIVVGNRVEAEIMALFEAVNASGLIKVVGTNENQYKNLALLRPRGVLRSFYPGRLGNNMFQYAALLGISAWNNVTPVIHVDSPLLEIFEITVPPARYNKTFPMIKVINPTDLKRASWSIFNEQKLAHYDHRYRNIDTNSYNAIGYYFQSWKYFTHIEPLIKDCFRFRPSVSARAEAYWTTHVAPRIAMLATANEAVAYHPLPYAKPLVIGLHVRRGDFTKDKNRLMASKEWLVTAMNNYRTKFRPRPLLFLVCSNGIPWCVRNLNDTGHAVVFSNGNGREIDLALLTRCDHTIMTAGSFGWWASYLAGGDVIYMRKHVRPKSWLAAFFNELDYMPPTWVGL